MRLTASFFLLLGLAILPFAFIASIWSGIGVLSENERVIFVLEGNLQQGYLAILESIALNGILPIAASIVLLVMALLKENSPTRFRTCLPLIVSGVVLILWGMSYIQSSYLHYYDTLYLAHGWPIESADSNILSIYVACGFVGGLWLLAGILLAVLYPLKALYRPLTGQPAVKESKVSLVKRIQCK